MKRPEFARGEQETAQAPGHIPGLDGLRAVAATLVFAYHTWGHWNYKPVAFTLFGSRFDLTWILHYGTEGVSIFFVLSGFLLSLPFWRALTGTGRAVNLRDFFKRRFLRIYPAYIVAVFIFALFYDVGHPLLTRLALVASHVLLIHNLTETTVFSLSSPLWSVGTEFQMYLLLPALFLLIALSARHNRRFGLAAALLFVISGLFAIAFYSLSKPVVAALHVSPALLRPDGDVLPHLPTVGISYFATGIAFGYAYLWLRDRRGRPGILSGVAAEFAGVAAVLLIAPVAMASPVLAGISTLIWPRLALLYGILVTAVALGGALPGLTWLLELRPVRWVGAISYSFYLYHDFVLHITFHYLPDLTIGSFIPNDVAKGLLAYVITLVVSAISYYLIETRFHGSRKATTRRAPALQPVVEHAERLS